MTPKVRGRMRPLRAHGRISRRLSKDQDRDWDRDRDVEAGVEKGKGKGKEEDTEDEKEREGGEGGTKKGRTPLRVRWARFKKRIGTGSNISDSILDPLESVSASATEASIRQQIERVNGGAGATTETGAEKSGDAKEMAQRERRQGRDGKEGKVRVEEEPVDEIVVDNVFLTGERAGSVTHTHSHTASHPPSDAPNLTSGGTTTHGECGTGFLLWSSYFQTKLNLIWNIQEQNLYLLSRDGTGYTWSVSYGGASSLPCMRSSDWISTMRNVRGSIRGRCGILAR